ncbi:MAG: response regulator [Oligoflexus sp.]
MSKKPSRILIVEDESDLSEIMETVLEDEGYHVDVCVNGLEALNFLSTSPEHPNLIILDIKMPVMDGRQFAQEYRKLYNHKVPIIVTTASDDARTRAAEIGVNNWLGKPFDIEKLIELVERIITPG